MDNKNEKLNKVELLLRGFKIKYKKNRNGDVLTYTILNSAEDNLGSIKLDKEIVSFGNDDDEISIPLSSPNLVAFIKEYKEYDF